MPLQETSGNATADAYGGGAAVVPTYIEDVFSTWLYTGNASTQTITNNIDLAGKGGLLWIKSRTNPTNGTYHFLYDNVRGQSSGYYNSLASNTSDSSNIGGSYPGSYYGGVNSFNADGFTLATPGNGFYFTNSTSGTYASWTFRKQPKFFDIVTYTGNGVSGRSISHNLGSAVGAVIIKKTSATGDWIFWHRSLSTFPQSLLLNTTDAAGVSATYVNGYVDSTTSTTFTVNAGSDDADINASGATYVAYLFAHNAGGFGLTGTDNVISCGSYTGNGSTSGPTVTLGYEPQWLLVKRASAGANDWILFDNMRGMPVGSVDSFLRPNTSQAEDSLTDYVSPTATGFNVVSASSNVNTSGNDYIYIAIRRGPMKVPTDATKVFLPISTPPSTTVTVGFVPDFSITKQTDNGAGSSSATYAGSRLQGNGAYLSMSDTSAEGAFGWSWDSASTKFSQSSVGTPVYSELFARAPSFFDEVCYTGNDTGTRILDHNLAVFPELVIVKKRSGSLGWAVQASTFTTDNILFLNTNAALTSTASYLSYPEQNTSTQFKVRYNLNVASDTYVAYLFATCAGVSKVGSYSGTGATQTISCGFTGGARFVLIKRTDSTGNWWYWDTTRGMVASNDQRMPINDTTVQANANWVYTTTGGFQIVTSDANVNANGGSYLFLAIS